MNKDQNTDGEHVFTDNDTVNLFVYGTLKEGFGNHKWHLGKATKVGTATVSDFGYLISLGAFPAAIPDADRSLDIQGELYQVNAEELRHIDGLEGYPNFYNRTSVEAVKDADGQRVESLMYYLQHTAAYSDAEPLARWPAPMRDQ